MILTQLHKPNKSKLTSDIIHICHAGDVCLGYCSYIPIFLGASFIKLYIAYAFILQEVQYAEIN